jgi:hypothetical protein
MDWTQVLEIQQVLNGYFLALDERNLEVAQLNRLFTLDARVVRPNGTALVGPATIAQSHRESLARFSSTQHLLASPDVAIDRESASVRANLVAMHLWPEAQGNANSSDNYFLAGGVIKAAFVRTSEGWRISQLDRVVWRAGGGFERMAGTGRST